MLERCIFIISLRSDCEGKPTNIIFKTIVMLKMNENQHNSHRISGEYGPINLSYDNRSYNLDFIDSHFSSMVVY